MSSLDTSVKALAHLINRKLHTTQSEELLQSSVERQLEEAGANFLREKLLSSRDRVDFFFPNSGVALELKLKKGWSKMDVFRQIERYAEHEEVKALVLLTNIQMTLPTAILSKPAFVISLREGV